MGQDRCPWISQAQETHEEDAGRKEVTMYASITWHTNLLLRGNQHGYMDKIDNIGHYFRTHYKPHTQETRGDII